MAIREQLIKFENSAREILKDATTEKEIVERIKLHFQTLLQTKDLLPAEYKQPNADKYSQFLLYKPEDEIFSIVGFVWGPGQTAPIHDHLVWGLVGIYEGAIEETRYLKVPDAAYEKGYRLEKIGEVHANCNDISFVYPPNADIHSVRNPYEQPAITIHVYGTDIGKQKRHIYHYDTHATSDVITVHKNNSPIYN